MDCKHEADYGTAPEWSFKCKHCGVDMCTDCGSTPRHEDSISQKCRRCACRGGDWYAFETKIDHDLLRAKVGRELAAEILRECKTWG